MPAIGKAAAFAAASFAPVPLLAMAAVLGGPWGWVALGYLTLLAVALDALIAAQDGPDSEFPAATALSVALALAHFALLGLVVWRFGQGVAPAEGVAIFLAAGLFFGQISNANAHELIHRGARGLHGLGNWVYISLLFGHHSSAHALVHHRFVATPDDPNTARAGEGYYAFLLRAWAGSFLAGLKAESARRAGAPWWRHPYAGYTAGAALCAGGALALGGPAGLGGFLALALFAQAQLLLSDYVQHYGLERREIAGRLEPVGDPHSWNAPQVFTSHMLLHAPRHSAHHRAPGLRFDALTLPDGRDAPMLPASLPVMSLVALCPPLWRTVMDPRLAFWQAQALSERPR